MLRRFSIVVVVAGILIAGPLRAQAPTIDARTRGRARAMLKEVHDAIKDNYYDPTFHGMDLDARFKEAEQALDTAQSLGQAMAIIAQAVLDLGDSHTYFIPPSLADSFDYGWRMQMIGDECFVVAVRPGSDAEAKGLTPGDRLLRLDPFLPQRGELWKIQYLLGVLSPRTVLNVVVQRPGGEPRALSLAAKVTKGRRFVTLSLSDLLNAIDDAERQSMPIGRRIARVGDVAIWKIPSFGFDAGVVDRVFDTHVAGASGLVLDMRGNAGGLITALQQVTARLFDHDVKLADVKSRKSSKPLVARAHKRPFPGRIVLLVDSESASAAEALARIVQLERRGTVIGDTTAGSVMQARLHPMAMGIQSTIFYGASIADANLIMPDGRSLERVGVTPDERLLPTAQDLAAGRDPVLARAVSLLGGTLDPEAAGKLFPVEWQ